MPNGLEPFDRRNLRLRGYDYSRAGAYFVTVCAQQRACLFGAVVDEEMHLNAAGEMVLRRWERLSIKYPRIEVDAVVVMPNHLHGVILVNHVEDWHGREPNGRVIAETEARGDGDHIGPGDHTGSPLQVGGGGLTETVRQRPGLGDIVGWFKTMTTNDYIRGVKEFGWEPFPGRLWQRNYYEHIIRNERGHERIRAYIAANPSRWPLDEDNPDRVAPAVSDGPDGIGRNRRQEDM